MVNDENYRNFTRTRPNKGFYQPDEPNNHKKEREEGKGARAKEKKTTAVFSFYSVESRGGFLRATWFSKIQVYRHSYTKEREERKRAREKHYLTIRV